MYFKIIFLFLHFLLLLPLRLHYFPSVFLAQLRRNFNEAAGGGEISAHR